MSAIRARVAVIDDWQQVARQCADWSSLLPRAEVEFFERPFDSDEARCAALADFEVIVPMRERSQFPRSLLERLPRLRLLALTGFGVRHVDVEYCSARGILCCGSGTYSPAAPAELTLALILAAMRHVTRGDARMRAGGFQRGVPLGQVLDGKTLGIIGLGRIGARVATYARALGMHLIAWSQNLTLEHAQQIGVTRVSKQELCAQADVITLHLISSERTRATIGAEELSLMKVGALLVNTSRGPLVEEAALLAALRAGRIAAALDVYDQEPLPADHPLRSLDNVVLTPHLGFCTQDTMAQFYGQSVENILAYLDNQPLRVLNTPSANARG